MDPVAELAAIARRELRAPAGVGGLGGTGGEPEQPEATTNLGWAGGEAGVPEAGVIVAHGSGEKRVPPDSVNIAMGAEVQGATLEEARHGAAEKAQGFLGALKGLGIEGLVLQTTGMDLYPVHSERRPLLGRDEMPTIVGYRACVHVMARLRGRSADELVAAASKIVDTAAQSGANKIDGIALGLERPELPAREALAAAVKDARGAAEALAAAAGTSLGALHSITDGEPDRYGGKGFLGARSMGVAAMAGGPASTPIEAGDITVRRSVVVRWYFAKGAGGGE